MAKIQRLDAHLTNMIAAGEVVERPMGVVKELVENSIDAKAKNIEIHIKQGGLEEINIIDDGCGMSAADATLAFERHATSKIYEMNDLWKISTMGFRGEALPSIASVSHVCLKTNDGTDSTEVEIKFGKVLKAGPVGTPKGTQILVQNLFQKTPARLKHLKTVQYEFSLISDVIQKFALAHIDIAFELTHDGKTIFSSQGSGNMLQVIMEIYGRDCAKSAMEINKSDDDYTIGGYAIQPSITRASKYYMLIYINQRMIRSYRLQKAILDAYAPYTPSDRYPIVVLNIKMDPKLVDVNVHPSKWEVRLSKEKQLEHFIKDTISEVLRNKLQVNQVERKEKEVVHTPSFEFHYQEKHNEQKQDQIVEPILQEISEEFKVYVDANEKDSAPEESKNVISEPEVKKEKIISEEEPVMQSVNPSFPQMEVIGQLHGSYILAQGQNGMYIVDQHAAQERYHFEVISKMLLNGTYDTQPLLIPIRVESSVGAIAQIDEINALLENIAIHFEAFGNHTFIIREIPTWMSKVKEEAFLSDMIDFYLKNGEVSIESLRKHAIATMACHSSIRFNRNLNKEEMIQVIQDLKHCEQPFHCPHGRPTFIEMTLKELEKDFYRVK